MRIIYLVLIIVAIIGVSGNLVSQGSMQGVVQNFQTSITTIAYAGEFEQIKTSVNEFLELRTIHDEEDRKIFAAKIDERLNNLQLVKIYCDQEISTLELSYEKNPYESIQKLCPKLNDMSFLKSVQLFRLI